MLKEREAGRSHLADCVSFVCLQMKWEIGSFIEAVIACKWACSEATTSFHFSHCLGINFCPTEKSEQNVWLDSMFEETWALSALWLE